MTRVLIVDDERSTWETFQTALEGEGYDVIVTADLVEAEPFLVEHACDVVVADVVLPCMNGLTLLQRVRQIDMDIPVIIVTGEPDVATAAEAVRHGAYDYMAKPVTQKVLIQAVDRAAEKKCLLDEKRRLEAQNRAYQAELEKKIVERTAELEQRVQEERKRAAQLAVVNQVARQIASILDLDQLLQQVVTAIQQGFDYHSVALFLCSPLPDRECGELKMLTIAGGFEGIMTPGYRQAVGVGMIGWTAETGQSLLANDVSQEPHYFAGVLEGKITNGSELCVPLKLGERVIGVLDVMDIQLNAFDETDIKALETLAGQIAVAIDNARLFEETNRRLNELSLLHDVALASAATLDLDEILRHTVESVRSKLQLETFGFLLVDEAEGVVRLHPTFLGAPGQIEGFCTCLGEGITGWVAQTGEPILAPDVGREPRYLDVDPDVCSEVCVPLKVGDKIIGVIDAESTRLNAFSEDDVRLFSTLAAQLSVVLEKARLFEETRHRLIESQVLQEVMQAAASTLDFDKVLTRAIETLHKTLGIEYLNFVLPDEQGGYMVLHPSQIGYTDALAMLHLPIDGSVVGRVYQSGEPLVIPDVRQVPYYFEGIAEIRSELAVPVKVADRVVAVLNAESPSVGAFGEEDKRLFSAVAAQLGVVLENARLYEETDRRLADAMLLQEVMLAAASTLNFDLVLERTVKALHRALKIDRLGFLLPSDWDDVLVPHPSLVGFARTIRVPVEGSLAGQAYRTGQPMLVRDAERGAPLLDQSPDVRSALAVPVRIGSRIIAVLHAESPQADAFSLDELRLFTTIAGQMGVALENARLYQKLETQTAELSRAYDELREFDRLRAELVQNVGHELRTPLGLVKGYANLLLEGELGDISDDQRDALRIVHARTATLERLIHNLTVLQAVPQETLKLVPVSVVEVVKHALAEFWVSAEDAGIALQDELPSELLLVLGDQDRLRLVFSHLMDNALKFSPDGGTVIVRARADRENVYVSIIDQGIGIPFEHRVRIFERFYQVDGSASRRFGGMGVGLALAWEIVEAHGGTVVVESEPGQGSVFTVVLPRPSSDLEGPKEDTG